ncbi:complement C1q and tumor necrosis factor-related protein 9B-like [Asterias rubens]|uniref:complement C1q and tumor necrosis factor-related protein 9B-like n=1 Tax=Asterias rubens TaxID=7604 RepID=UPI0014551B4D|nr:complement C1q and tumor necrosis factor-related protein 9B-like [Asterias rubens]
MHLVSTQQQATLAILNLLLLHMPLLHCASQSAGVSSRESPKGQDSQVPPSMCQYMLRGETGPYGPPGLPGIQGPAGMPGNHGNNGNNGLTGRPGPKGDQGSPGEVGTYGPAGQIGPIGPQGPTGKAGIPGTAGVAGATGARGQRGTSGAPGVKGEKGDSGSGIESRQILSRAGRRKIAFSVASSNTMTAPAEDAIIQFDHVFTLHGNEFDPDTGKFTCQVNGTYYFVVHANKWTNSRNLHIKLMKNGILMTALYEDAGYDYYDAASNSILLDLTHGDRVWLQLHSGSEVYSGLTRMTTFSGWLVFED